MSRVLLIDNDGVTPDTPTMEALLNLLRGYSEFEVDVIAGDDLKSGEVKDSKYSAVILSGGSFFWDYGKVGVLKKFILSTSLPMFGICWGAQAIAGAYGATPRAKELKEKRMGWQKVRIVRYDGIFKDVPEEFSAYELHQFVMGDFSDDKFEVLAKSSDGVEVFRVRDLSVYGVQFHPEFSDVEDDSSARRILDNFLREHVGGWDGN